MGRLGEFWSWACSDLADNTTGLQKAVTTCPEETLQAVPWH
ncbi:hypothetical protein [Streptomyces sp. NPDC093707]